MCIRAINYDTLIFIITAEFRFIIYVVVTIDNKNKNCNKNQDVKNKMYSIETLIGRGKRC